MVFFRKNQSQEIRQIESALKSSFDNVKNDTAQLHQWVRYLHDKAQQQEQHIQHLNHHISSLHQQLHYLPKSREEMRDLIDRHYDIEPIKQRVKDLHARIDQLTAFQEPVTGHINHLYGRVSKLEEGGTQPQKKATKTAIQERILKNISRNSKDYVKNLIISLIRKYEKVPALKLREMVVEEQGLCSKSSFYRLMEEIEKMDEIGVIVDGKEKVFLSKITSAARK